jgi:hypothetical protein
LFEEKQQSMTAELAQSRDALEETTSRLVYYEKLVSEKERRFEADLLQAEAEKTALSVALEERDIKLAELHADRMRSEGARDTEKLALVKRADEARIAVENGERLIAKLQSEVAEKATEISALKMDIQLLQDDDRPIREPQPPSPADSSLSRHLNSSSIAGRSMRIDLQALEDSILQHLHSKDMEHMHRPNTTRTVMNTSRRKDVSSKIDELESKLSAQLGLG